MERALHLGRGAANSEMVFRRHRQSGFRNGIDETCCTAATDYRCHGPICVTHRRARKILQRGVLKSALRASQRHYARMSLRRAPPAAPSVKIMNPDAQRRLARIRSSAIPSPIPADRCNRDVALRNRAQHRVMVGDSVADDVDLAFLLETPAHRDHRRQHHLPPVDLEREPKGGCQPNRIGI